MSASWQYKTSLILTQNPNNKNLTSTTNKSASVGVVGPSPIVQRIWKGPCLLVYRVIGRQTLTRVVEPTRNCEVVLAPLSCSGNTCRTLTSGRYLDKRALVKLQMSREVPPFRWSKKTKQNGVWIY